MGILTLHLFSIECYLLHSLEEDQGYPTKRVPTSVALISSFRKHYQETLEARQQFVDVGMSVASPRENETAIIDTAVDFVRFTSNIPNHSDAEIETKTMRRILSADFVYCVDPGGYVGRTVCYEIGRIIQAQKPLYFMEMPQDLPVAIRTAHVIGIDEICDRIRRSVFHPSSLWEAL